MKTIIVVVLQLTGLSFCLNAQEFELLKDIKELGPFEPSGYVKYDGKLYFTGYESIHGTGLWVTDGTQEGTYLIKDFKPGNTDHTYISITAFNGYLYIGIPEYVELWKTDGTEQGTQLVKDIKPGKDPNFSSFSNFIIYNNYLYFTADDGIHGNEIWRTDGTTIGTELFKDVNPGSNWSYPAGFNILNGKLIFWASDSAHGSELWISDGTTNGTILLADINPGIGSSSSGNGSIVYDNKLYFTASDGVNPTGLWTTDGIVSGTQMLINLIPSNFCVYDNLLYFSTSDTSGNGTELWVTDGTVVGTHMVKDINPGSGSSNPQFLTVFNGKLYFYANDGATGIELWSTDGTASSTTLLRDIYTGSNGVIGLSSQFPPPIIFNNRLFFLANDSINGREIWSTDGTANGTQLLSDINKGNGGSAQKEFIVFNGKLYFNAWGGGNFDNELWTSDGTTGGTQVVKPFVPRGDSKPRGFFTLNDQLFFTAEDLDYRKLWVSDGTTAGTALFGNLDPIAMTPFNGKGIFASWDSTHGIELWITDGTPQGTEILLDINPGDLNALSNETKFVEFNGYLYFAANDGRHGVELWRTDGTTAGTSMYDDIIPTSFDSYPDELTVLNDRLLFMSYFDIYGRVLVATDGSPNGIYLVKEITTNGFTVLNDHLYFYATDDSLGYELWRTNGTDTGTYIVKDINPGLAGSSNSTNNELFTLNDKIIFWANDGSHGNEPWTTDGTEQGTQLLIDIFPGATGSASYPAIPALVNNNRFYFMAEDTSIYGAHLWVTDGTETGTYQISQPAVPIYASLLTAYHDKVYFRSGHLCSVDRFDNIECYTPDFASSDYPNQIEDVKFHVYHDRLYFAAQYDDKGREPYSFKDTSSIDTSTSIIFIDELQEPILFYPNPVAGANIQFEWKGNSNEFAEIRIYTGDGRLIEKRDALLINGTNKILLPAMNQGIHLVSIKIGAKIFTRKIVALN